MKSYFPPHSHELPPDLCAIIHARLFSFLPSQKPFLRARYSITQLSQDIDVPSYQLSAFINRQLGRNFNDYINQFRIKHCQQLIRQRKAERFNIYGLAFECGFHNRNSFTAAFKKFTGYTPSAYLQMQILREDLVEGTLP